MEREEKPNDNRVEKETDSKLETQQYLIVAGNSRIMPVSGSTMCGCVQKLKTTVIVLCAVVLIMAAYLAGMAARSDRNVQPTGPLKCYHCASYYNSNPTSQHPVEIDCGDNPQTSITCNEGEMCGTIYREVHVKGKVGKQIHRVCHPPQENICTTETRLKRGVVRVDIVCFCDTDYCIPFKASLHAESNSAQTNSSTIS